MYSIRLILLLGLISSAQLIWGQEVIITDLSPMAGPLTPERFTMVSLTNGTPETVMGTLRASLRDKSGKLVAEIYTRQFGIASGQQLAYTTIPWLRRFTYGSSSFATTLATQGKLGYGDFVLCHEFIDDMGQQRGEHCAEKQAALDLTFSLIYPFDQATIETTRPNLTWEEVGQYGLDAVGLTYELLLVDMSEGQSAATALEQNVPLLLQRNLRRSSLLYPLGNRQLKVGGTYAWRVRVFKNMDEVIASLPWVFKIGQTETLLPEPNPGAYAMPSTSTGGRPHQFGAAIQVGFDNNEGVTQFDYRVLDLAQRGEPVGSVPPITGLHPGLNTIDIPTGGMGLKEGQLYRLEIRTTRNQSYFLQFRYTPTI